MDRESLIYDLFIDKLIDLLKSDEITDKQLSVILKFLEDNNIGADPSKNPKLKEAQKLVDDLDLPFGIEEMPEGRL